jgi:hypothetical protein
LYTGRPKPAKAVSTPMLEGASRDREIDCESEEAETQLDTPAQATKSKPRARKIRASLGEEDDTTSKEGGERGEG